MLTLDTDLAGFFADESTSSDSKSANLEDFLRIRPD